MPIGNNLKKIIKKSGLTTTEVGDLIGRGRETVSRHMNGHTQMSMSDANKYADVLKCEPEDKIGYFTRASTHRSYRHYL